MRYKRKIFPLIILVALLATGWVVLNREPEPIDDSQKKEAIEKILGREARGDKNIPQGEKSYEGKFFSLSYPAYSQIYERENSGIAGNKNLLEYLRIDSEEPKFRFVAMVESADAAVLDELTGVKARRLDEQYKETAVDVDSKTGVMFVKTQGRVERASFFLENGKSYSFVVTGVDAGELEKIYGQIMQSLLLK